MMAEADRTETQDQATAEPSKVEELVKKWEAWATRAHVIPWIWKPQYGEKDGGAEPAKKNAKAGKREREIFERDEIRVETRATNLQRRKTAPATGGRAFQISAEIQEFKSDGVIVAQGGTAEGFTLYVKDAKPMFAIRRGGKNFRKSPQRRSSRRRRSSLEAALENDGTMTLESRWEKVWPTERRRDC